MLLDVLQGHRIVAIIGLTKNTGKTTTFNHLVRQAIGRGLQPGLVSIGRNGERWDALTRERKPLIWAPSGAWVATAETALVKSRVQLRHTSVVVESPFGPILLGQVLEPGPVELIGPQTGAGVRAVAQALLAAGAEFVLVDGTFGRRFTAAAGLSDGLILATGATAGNTLQAVVERTRYLAGLFQLPPPPGRLRDQAARLLESGRVSLVTAGGESVALPFRTALGQGAAIVEAIRSQAAPVEALVLPGALTNGLAGDLAAAGGPPAIVVADPACLLLDAPHARRLIDHGVRCYPLRVTPLLAVTVNPYRGGGRSLPASELRELLAEALAPVPVVNVTDEGAVLLETEGSPVEWRS